VLNTCSSFVGASVHIGYKLDRPEHSVQVDVYTAQVQREAEIWRRFGGGSDRNRALLGNPVQRVHDMQIVQGRINTGDCVSR
jgi:hypothetical protein